MTIDNPRQEEIPALRALWKQAFGDTEEFLDCFFTAGFSYDRCRCIFADSGVVAALYWFEGTAWGRKMAYLYAVATEKTHRGQGMGHLLLANTHAFLRDQGYEGVLLKPAEGLEGFYASMGYAPFGAVTDREWEAGEKCYKRRVEAEEYGLLRREFLPRGSFCQDGALLRFLATRAELYTGEDFLAAVSREKPAEILEFLGNREKIPGLLGALHLQKARVYTPGGNAPAGMYLSLTQTPISVPAYMGLAMD